MALDIRVLRRLGALRRGECVITPVRWSTRALRMPSGRLRIDLSDPERGGTVTITGSMFDGTINQRINVELVPAPLGGHRCYFICPATGERCEVLYYLAGRFGSRRFHRLSYTVQNVNELSRARRTVAKLRSRLKGQCNFPRPRGRNRIGVIERLREAEAVAHELYIAHLRASVDRSGSPY
jgi:hypothetical protein